MIIFDKNFNMLKYTFIICAFVLNSFLGTAKTDFHRILFDGNASQSVIISWHQESGQFLKLYYDTQDHGTEKEKYQFQASLSDTAMCKGLSNHFVRLNPLKPNTKYYFVIEDSEGLSRRFWFKTVHDDPRKPLSIIAGGDSRSGRAVRQKGNLMVSKLKPDVVVFGGDFTGGDTKKQWRNFFEDWNLTIAKDGRIFPMIIARGNHEHTNSQMIKFFMIPHEKVYYNVQLGGNLLNIMTLNTEIQKGLKQMSFVKKSLKEYENHVWNIIQYHKPCRPHVEWKKEGFGQRRWIKKFQKYNNIKLVIECDAHTCKTTYPIVTARFCKDCEKGFKRDDANGIVYVGEGSWGAPLREANDKKVWTRDAEAVNQFNWVFVYPDRLEVRKVLYENAAEVEENGNDTSINIPKNVKFWDPPNGSKEIIIKKINVEDRSMGIR